jgi:hypothetical protein
MVELIIIFLADDLMPQATTSWQLASPDQYEDPMSKADPGNKSLCLHLKILTKLTEIY